MKQSKPTHLRDEIQKILTLYTLVPILFVVLAFCVFFLVYFNSSIINTTKKYNYEVSSQLNSMVVKLSAGAEELSRKLDTDLIREDQKYRQQILTYTVKSLNHLDVRADFFIFDRNFMLILGTQDRQPVFTPPVAGINWGIVQKLRTKPDVVQYAFVPTGTSHRQSKTLAVGKGVPGNLENFNTFIVFSISGLYLSEQIGDNPVNLVVTNKYNDICISNTKHFTAEFNRAKQELITAKNFFSFNGEWYYLYKKPLDSGELIIYTAMPIKNTVALFLIYGSLFIIIILLVALTTVISSSKLAKSKMKLMDQIVEAFDNVRKGNLDTRMNIHTDDEFGFIGDSYNIMLESLKQQIETNTQLTRETIVSEIKQLESQFNPHFLFNTLETIKFMVKFSPDDAAGLIVALSSILRYSINNTIKNVTLREDLLNVKNYLLIQEKRFSGQFFYHLNIEPEANNCIIPKLIFQPLIENSIIYGFEEKEFLNVYIDAYLTQSDLQICVRDDGDGMSPERLNEMRKIINSNENLTKHIGIYNVSRRIKLTYGEEYGMELFSIQGEGTTVNLRLPVRRKEITENVESINC